MRYHAFVVCLFVYTIFPFKLFAQTQIDIGEVIVEAESVKSSLQLQKESVTGKYIIPRADLLGFGYSNAGDVIKNLPLVYLDGDPGVNRNVNIGGLSREYQAILINGKQPAGGEDSRDLKLDRIPLSMIERIEIDYNASVSLGTAGIAGTINIILKEAPDFSGINAQLVSSINTTDPLPGLRADIESSAQLGKLDIYAGVNYSSYQRLKTTTLYDSSTDISGGVEESIITNTAGANLALSRKLGEFGSLNLKGFFSWFDEDEFEYADVKRRKDGTLNVRETDTENDKLRYLMVYDLGYRLEKDKNQLNVSAGFSNNFEKRHKDQLQEKSTYFEELREYEDQDNYSATADILYKRKDINLGNILAVFNSGLRYSNNFRSTERVNANRPEGYLLWDITDESYKLDESILSLFSDLEISISKKLEILPALNFEYSGGGFSTADTSGHHQFNNLSPSIHTNYHLSESIVLNGGLARHISRPAFMSMVPVSKVKIKKDLIETGNPNLVPSKAISTDLGVTYYFNKSSYFSSRVYYKWVRDMIELKYVGIDPISGYNIYSFVNIDTASVYGFYIDSRIDFNPDSYSGLSMKISYTYMDSKTPDSLTGGSKRVDDQPAHLVSLKLDYLDTDRRFNISTGINYNSDRVIAPFISDEMVEIPETREKGYFTLAARIKYFFNERGSVYLAADNLLMQDQQVTQGTVREHTNNGATVRLGVNYNFIKK